MKNFFKRALTGLVLLIIMIWAILTPAIGFGAVFLAINMLCLYEFYAMSYHIEQTKPISKWAMVGGAMMFSAVFFGIYLKQLWLIPLMYVPFFTGTFVVEIFRNNGSPILNVALSILGHIYISLPFSCLCLMESFGGWNGGEWKGGLFVLCFFIAIWVSDTGAYLVGMTIGKHKLYERVSPKKSWEGFWGGFVLACLVGYFLGKFLVDSDYNPHINDRQLYSLEYCIFFALVSVLGTLGDLVESLFKRYFQVKDSSNLLPGHGGFLDRFDSALVAAPFAFALLIMFFYA